MDKHENDDNEIRIKKLETEVASLKELVNSLIPVKSTNELKIQQPPISTPPPPPKPVKPAPSYKEEQPVIFTSDKINKPTETVKTEKSSFNLPAHMKTSEYWLNKIGIGLVLFAVVFLFKYSIDQGWLVPPVRIGFGLALGLALNIISFRMYKQRRHFSLVLSGGGIATFYITGFAAYQFFSLVPHLTAMLFMILVTLFAISISLKQNEQILSLIGAIGGLATPFLLYSGTDNIPGLMMYTCVLIVGTVMIYFFKSWRALFWIGFIGGWLIIGAASSKVAEYNETFTSYDRWSVQFALIICWISFGLIPVLREAFAQINPEKYRYIKFKYLRSLVSEQFEQSVKNHAYLSTIFSPILVLNFSMNMWGKSANQEFWGWICMGLAMLYWVISYNIHRLEKLQILSHIHSLLGLLFLTISFTLLLDGNTLLFTLSAEALLLYYLSVKNSIKRFSTSSFILYAIIAMWLFTRIMFENQSGTEIWNLKALTDLWVISTGFAIAYLTSDINIRRIFIIASFAFLAGLFFRELEGNLLFFILTIEAAVMMLLAARLKDNIIVTFGHIFYAILGLWLIDRLLLTKITTFPIVLHNRPFLNLTTLTDCAYLISILFISKQMIKKEEKTSYLLWSHIIILAIFLRELQGFENGQGYVSIAWGVYASLLLIFGLRLNKDELRKISIATLLLVVGKLFLIDLANLETIWRILLFFAFGGLFLFLSYYFKALWNKNKPK